MMNSETSNAISNASLAQLETQIRATCREVGESETRVLDALAQRLHVARDTNREFTDTLTLGQRVADKVAAFGGSWPFIFLFFAVLISWIVLNSLVLARLHAKIFDPYPFILLNLVLSMLASLQAPVIMMSQNRQSAKDRLDASHDYEVNLKAEMEILALHSKIDAMREAQWGELVEMQREQIRLLGQLLAEKS